jgi:1-aminocyclopropane-1-carboxylate deaminase/D-cysteine desulfhydrase-like pyridoxal-dependent ACC family enzyme
VEYSAAASYAGVPGRVLAARARGGFYVAPGGSSAIGSYGYVDAAFELAAQIRDGACPPFDLIYVALGSCGTAGGLWLGLRAAGIETPIVAVRVVDRIVSNRGVALRIARAVARRLDLRDACRSAPTDDDLRVDHRFFGGGYGVATPATADALERARTLGITLEATYTGKTFAALLADAGAGLLRGKRVLFWNTFSSADLGPLLARYPGPHPLPARLARIVEGPPAP